MMPRAVGGWMAGFDTRADRERSLCVPLGRLRADRPRAIGAALTELGTFWIWRVHNVVKKTRISGEGLRRGPGRAPAGRSLGHRPGAATARATAGIIKKT